MRQRTAMIAAIALTAVAGTMTLAGPAALAEGPVKMLRVGMLDAAKLLPKRRKAWRAFQQKMRELGYVEGRNVSFDQRQADGVRKRLPGLARELVNSKVDVIVTAGTTAAFAASRATSKTPIVMAVASASAVVPSLVKTLANPGGNLTGVLVHGQQLTIKRFEIAKEIVPSAARIALLGAQTHSGFTRAVESAKAGSPALGVSLLTVGIETTSELDRAFSTMAKARVDAFVVAPSSLMSASRLRIVKLAAGYRIPAVFPERFYAETGGLASYGTNQFEMFRQAAVFVAKVLKGADPAELPAERAKRFEFVVNLNTAKALGIFIPRSILLRADEVVE